MIEKHGLVALLDCSLLLVVSGRCWLLHFFAVGALPSQETECVWCSSLTQFCFTSPLGSVSMVDSTVDK